MKRFGIILSLFSLLFLFSCGIPYIYQIDSRSISISSRDNQEENSKSITIRLNDPELASPSFNDSSSPEVVLFYIVRDNTTSSQYNSLISSFNSQYCDEFYGLPITTLSRFDYTNSSTDKTYSLYQFYDNLVLGNEYLLDDNSFSFNLSYSEDSKLLLSVTRKDGTKDVKELRRFNGSSFPSSSASYEEYISGDDSPSNISVYVYATITFNMRDYTNIWSKKLSSSNSIFSFDLQ